MLNSLLVVKSNKKDRSQPLLPTPYSLLPTPYSLFPVPFTILIEAPTSQLDMLLNPTAVKDGFINPVIDSQTSLLLDH
ncbi:MULTISPECIES: hypothetical protein [unclassified Moorena]|uniref:hypothetical protein n=1 Tax=unclassified Moorena TaxID=2683338 RepID=UPI00140077CA|nr:MULTISPECIES: hypothetical protein [unclassified Moorena]NEO11441.1 hypothetical protein [Moorena sp. SIO3E8]NEP97901.1 hypothetical protein [Moorena sp. SIO3F7]